MTQDFAVNSANCEFILFSLKLFSRERYQLNIFNVHKLGMGNFFDIFGFLIRKFASPGVSLCDF